MAYTHCTACGGLVVVDYPEIPGQKWHGFEDGGHMFSLNRDDLNEQLPQDSSEHRSAK